MRKSTLIGGLAGLAASMVLVLPPPASAQMAGGGGAGGGGGGSGEENPGEVYSDLFIAWRDVDGVPILSETFYEVGEVDPVAVTCIQPISYEPIPLDPSDPDSPYFTSTPNLGPDGPHVYLVPLQGEASLDGGAPVAEDTACAPQTEFESYASEVELERLNLVRTSDEVLWKKLAEVGTRLATADDISLDGAGRITTWTAPDDWVEGDPLPDLLDRPGWIASTIDASPDQAAIYAATEGDYPAPEPPTDGPKVVGEPGGLMDTGTIPHWIAGTPPALPTVEYPLGIPAQISGFDNWKLAAAAIGIAAGKPVPITVDTIEYYNRTATDGDVSSWGNVSLLPSIANDEGLFAGDPPPEKFVDYRNFRYTRANVFSGCTTWLDVGTLTWKWDTVMNRVDFIDIVAGASTSEVTNVAGFAQMADDVRSVIGYLHENEVVVNPDTGEGFFIDPVFEESCTEQAAMVDRLNEDADLARLMVTITDKPEDPTTETSATFEFKPLVPSIWNLEFHCKLDELVADCTSPWKYPRPDPALEFPDPALGLGKHTFEVYATLGGATGLTTIYTWTVISPLEVTITAGPDNPTYDTSATFEFVAAGEGVDFVCELDEVEFDPCESGTTYTDLDIDTHTFTVYATDGVEVGDVVEYTWEVKEQADLTVTITDKPDNPTTETSATFEFEAVDEGVVFVCELDEVEFDPCESGTTYTDLDIDTHTFTVYATDGVEVGDVVEYTWTVVLPLTVTITDKPEKLTTETSATFVFEAVDEGVVFVCGLDGEPIDPCVSGTEYSTPVGTHTFTVYATDGVNDPIPVEYTWEVQALTTGGSGGGTTGGSTGGTTVVASNPVPPTVVPPGDGSDVVSLNPVRLADTRAGWVAADGLFTGTGPVSGGQFVQVPVAGRGGVPAGANGAVLNVTIADPVAGGYATVYPCGTVPFTSSVNYSAGENVANELFVKLSSTGTICVYTSATANVIVDVAGFVPTGSDVVSLNPVRLADTRAGWVAADGLFAGTGPVSGGQFVQVPVAGRGGVPADAEGAVVNVTLAGPAADGYATVYPCGTVPFTSSLNYSAGENVANEVFAKLSATGTICVYTSATANVIVDVAGFVGAGSDYMAMNPVRLADTRAGWVAADGLFTGTGPVSGGQFVQVPVAGRGGVPVDATAVVANVTIADPVAGGYATVYPCGTVPFTSSVNYSAGENVANEVFATLSSTGTICVYTSATANVIVDVAGYM